MKILLAGGCGYVGTMLAEFLYREGYDITVIDEMLFGNDIRVPIKVIQNDLFNLTDADIIGFDQIIFLAGVSNDPMANFSPRANYIYNVALPIFLAYLAKKNGIRRFIFASSCSIYGYHPDKEFTEDDIPNCNYPYGISKNQAEKSLMVLQDDNFSVICLRKGTICGYSHRMRFDLVINAMYKSAMTTGAIIVDNPDVNRPILLIHDACRAYMCAVKADYSISGVFNIITFNINILDLAKQISSYLEILTKKHIQIDIKNSPNIRCYKANANKAKTMLNYTSTCTLQDALLELHHELDGFADYDNDKYYNVKVFEKLNL